MEIKYTTDAKAFEKYANECLAGHEGAIIHSAETPCIWTGLLPTYDKKEAQKRGFTVGVGQYYAGTIVCMPGDISICITTWGTCNKGKEVCDAVATLLEERGISVLHDGNDILAEGKKVASYCTVPQLSGWVQTVIHISIGAMDIDLVKAICTKPMEKTPGALSDLGIYSNDIMSIIYKLLNKRDAL